eukprot:601528-Rhodomonas_salina.1
MPSTNAASMLPGRLQECYCVPGYLGPPGYACQTCPPMGYCTKASCPDPSECPFGMTPRNDPSERRFNSKEHKRAPHKNNPSSSTVLHSMTLQPFHVKCPFKRCEPGREGPNGGPCTLCPAGSYADGIGFRSCTPCAPGPDCYAPNTRLLCPYTLATLCPGLGERSEFVVPTYWAVSGTERAYVCTRP